jgi:RNA polymerase sigma factor (sigma-70 family)
VVSPAAAASPPGPSRDEEIAEFFAAHYTGLRRYLISGCGCPEHQADDIAQDSFLAVREQWGHVRFYDKPKAYLYKVAVRQFGRLQREQAGRFCQGDPDEHLLSFPDPADVFAAADRRDAALSLLRQLPLRQRQVLWLRRGAGFSEAETAEILSVSPGTVKSQLHDATARMEELEHKARTDEWRTEPR